MMEGSGINGSASNLPQPIQGSSVFPTPWCVCGTVPNCLSRKEIQPAVGEDPTGDPETVPTHTPEENSHTRGPHWNRELEPEKIVYPVQKKKKPELPQKVQKLTAWSPILQSKNTLCRHPRVESTTGRPEPFIRSRMAAGVLQIV